MYITLLREDLCVYVPVFCAHQVKILIFLLARGHVLSRLGIVPHNFYTPGIGAIFIGSTTRIGPIVVFVIPDLYPNH